MRKFRTMTFIVVIGLLLGGISAVYAQNKTVLFAAIDGNSVYISRTNANEARNKTVFTEGLTYSNIQWDPQLLWLIFTYTDENGLTHLAVSDNTGAPAQLLVEDIASVPPSFTARGDKITYAKFSSSTMLDVYILGVRSFAGFENEAELIATIPYEMDCGVPELIAPQIALMREIGGAPDVNLNRQILYLSPSGLVHNEGCHASKTLLTNLESGETREVGVDLQWAVPSRNGMFLAGISAGSVMIAELEYDTNKLLDVGATPGYAIVWGDFDHPNSLYYAVRERSGRRSLDPEIESRVLALAGEEALNFWDTAIHEYNIATDTAEVIYSNPGYAIGTIATVDGNGLVFSQIPALRPWVDGLIDGTITDALDEQNIPVNLYLLDLDTRRRDLIAENIRGAAISPSPAFG